MRERVVTYLTLLLSVLSLTGCFTGVESTPRVTSRDVEKAISAIENRAPATLVFPVDSVPAWQMGKLFYVTDNQARLLFDHSFKFEIDTLQLQHTTLTYVGNTTGGVLDNRNTINLLFTHGNDTLVYRTGKTLEQFTPSFSIPLLIDMDMVDYVHHALAGREFYVKTSIWYDPITEDMLTGRHYIKVRIDSVAPGNKALPLRVHFTALDSGERAMMWMAGRTAMRNRDFDALFAARDPRADYPEITDKNWSLIVNGQVTIDMTKQECRLSLGAPKRITPIHDQVGLREYWYYDGGSYLFFVDGLLKQYRR